MERASKTRRFRQLGNKAAREGIVLIVQNMKSAKLIVDHKRITKAEARYSMSVFFFHISTKGHHVYSSLLDRRLQAL